MNVISCLRLNSRDGSDGQVAFISRIQQTGQTVVDDFPPTSPPCHCTFVEMHIFYPISVVKRATRRLNRQGPPRQPTWRIPGSQLACVTPCCTSFSGDLTRPLILSLKANVILVSINVFFLYATRLFVNWVLWLTIQQEYQLYIIPLRFVVIESFNCEYAVCFRLNYMDF